MSNIISAPVNLKSEIAFTLGVIPNIRIACTSENINQWSKKKPIRNSSIKALTDDERKASRYGFNHITMENSAVVANNKRYVYEKPRGITTYNERYRWLDFNGYNHFAKPPINIDDSHFGNLDWDMEYEKSFILEMIPNTSATDMQVEDFNEYIGDMYLAICIVDRADPNNYIWKTSGTKFKSKEVLPIWLYNTESMFMTSYVEYFLMASSTYKSTFEEERPANTVFLPIPSLEGNKYHLNISNWEAKMPQTTLDSIVLAGTPHMYEDYMVIGVNRSNYTLVLNVLLDNTSITDFLIEKQSLDLRIGESNGKFEEYWYGPEYNMNVPGQNKITINIPLVQMFASPESGARQMIEVSMRYKGIHLFNTSFFVQRDY